MRECPNDLQPPPLLAPCAYRYDNIKLRLGVLLLVSFRTLASAEDGAQLAQWPREASADPATRGIAANATVPTSPQRQARSRTAAS